jgi:hypothetical protein
MTDSTHDEPSAAEVVEMDKSESHNRWWEYYFVRYFPGTVVGALLILFLTGWSGSRLHGLGPYGAGNFADIKGTTITALAALGFLYCYIASTPILFWHTTRAYLGLNPLKFRWRFWIVTGVIITGLSFLTRACVSLDLLGYLGIFTLLAITGIQIGMITTAHRDRLVKLSVFYSDLATARARNKAAVTGYTESYRHLREHGNAVSIVFVEFVLAFILLAAPRRAVALLVVPIWILPSAYAWFVATFLESRLKNYNG